MSVNKEVSLSLLNTLSGENRQPTLINPSASLVALIKPHSGIGKSEAIGLVLDSSECWCKVDDLYAAAPSRSDREI